MNHFPTSSRASKQKDVESPFSLLTDADRVSSYVTSGQLD